MRLEHTVLHKVGPFDHLELDFASMPGPLVAVVAPNGSGKTFMLETSILGACYRRTETQGSPLARAWARDSYIQSTFVNGTRQTFRHTLDPLANPKKSEAIALGADDITPLWPDSVSVKVFDAWAEKHLPDPDVVKATTFAVQGSEGFISLGSAARIQVILEATGVARIERAATAARKEASRVEDELASVRVRIADAKEGAPNLETAEAARTEYCDAAALAETRATNMRLQLAEAEAATVARAELERQATAARETRDRIERDLQAARERVKELCRRYEAADPRGALATAEVAEQALTAARAAFAAAEEYSRVASNRRLAAIAAEEQRATLERDVHAARAAASSLAARVERGRGVIDRAEAIRAAAERLPAARAELAGFEAKLAESVVTGGGIVRSIAESESRLAGIDSRIARARETVQGREAVDRAAAALPDAEAAAAAALADQEAAEEAERALHGQHVAGAEERIGGLRGGIDAAEAAASLAPALAARAADAAAVDLAAALPGRILAAQQTIRAARERRAAADSVVTAARAAAARLAAILSAAEDLATAEAERSAIELQRAGWDRDARRLLDGERVMRAATEAIRAELPALEKEAGELENLVAAEAVAEQRRAELAAAEGTAERLRDELAALPAATPLPPPGAGAAAERAAVEAAEAAARAAAVAVGAAEATRRELEPQVSEVRATVERLVGELSAAPAVPELSPIVVDVAGARTEAELADRTARNLAAEAARAEQRLEQAKAAAARAAELEAKRAELEAELFDWARLALDLGRDGIQSALVDSAGPELTELANDLLRACHGNRYTVAIETRRALASGKGETDECRVMVIDTVAGTEKEAKEHSGGERVIIGESISLALTMLACKRAGVTDTTLVRDESGAALDPANARAYVAMLRRAAAVVGARHVLVVSHSPEVQDLCDHRIELPRKAVA